VGCLLVTGSALSALLPMRRHSCPPGRPPPTADQRRMIVWLAGCVPTRMAKLLCCCVTPVMGAFTCAALGCVGGVHLSAIGSARAALAHILPLLATQAAARGPMALALRPCTIPFGSQSSGSCCSGPSARGLAARLLSISPSCGELDASASPTAYPKNTYYYYNNHQASGAAGPRQATVWCLDRRSAMPKHQAPRSWRVRYCKREWDVIMVCSCISACLPSVTCNPWTEAARCAPAHVLATPKWICQRSSAKV
jgi:hypothetical protein